MCLYQVLCLAFRVPASQAGSGGEDCHNDVESSGGSLGTFTSGLSCVPVSQDVQVGRVKEAEHNDFEPSLGFPVSLGSEASLEADHVDVEPSLGSPVSPGSEDSELDTEAEEWEFGCHREASQVDGSGGDVLVEGEKSLLECFVCRMRFPSKVSRSGYALHLRSHPRVSYSGHTQALAALGLGLCGVGGEARALCKLSGLPYKHKRCMEVHVEEGEEVEEVAGEGVPRVVVERFVGRCRFPLWPWLTRLSTQTVPWSGRCPISAWATGRKW